MVNVSEEATSEDDSFEYDASELSASHHEHVAPPADTEVIELPEIYSGEPVFDRKSTFQGFLAKLTHKQQVIFSVCFFVLYVIQIF